MLKKRKVFWANIDRTKKNWLWGHSTLHWFRYLVTQLNLENLEPRVCTAGSVCASRNCVAVAVLEWEKELLAFYWGSCLFSRSFSRESVRMRSTWLTIFVEMGKKKHKRFVFITFYTYLPFMMRWWWSLDLTWRRRQAEREGEGIGWSDLHTYLSRHFAQDQQRFIFSVVGDQSSKVKDVFTTFEEWVLKK